MPNMDSHVKNNVLATTWVIILASRSTLNKQNIYIFKVEIIFDVVRVKLNMYDWIMLYWIIYFLNICYVSHRKTPWISLDQT